MAAQGDTGFEMQAHEGTYSSFVGLFKWGALGVAIVTIIVVLIISS